MVPNPDFPSVTRCIGLVISRGLAREMRKNGNVTPAGPLSLRVDDLLIRPVSGVNGIEAFTLPLPLRDTMPAPEWRALVMTHGKNRWLTESDRLRRSSIALFRSIERGWWPEHVLSC